MLYAIAAAFFSILKHASGERAALLGTILIVTTPSVIAELGTDYIDGPASVYNLIALPASCRRPRTVPELDRGALGRVSLPVLGRDAVRVAST